jgi:hypothetical protein
MKNTVRYRLENHIIKFQKKNLALYIFHHESFEQNLRPPFRSLPVDGFEIGSKSISEI